MLETDRSLLSKHRVPCSLFAVTTVSSQGEEKLLTTQNLPASSSDWEASYRLCCDHTREILWLLTVP